MKYYEIFRGVGVSRTTLPFHFGDDPNHNLNIGIFKAVFDAVGSRVNMRICRSAAA